MGMSEAQEAEFVVRLALQGMTYVVKVAGQGGMHLAAMLQAIIKEPDNSPGKKRLATMLKSKEVLRSFTINESNLEEFAKEAKRYGIQYCIVERDKDDVKAGIYDILVKDSDAVRLNRIIEKMSLGTVDGRVETDISNETVKGAVELSEAQKIMQDMFLPNSRERQAEEMSKEGLGDTGQEEPVEQFQSAGSYKSTDNKVSIREQLTESNLEAESIADVFNTAQNLRVNMMSENPEFENIETDIPGWEKPAKRYNEAGEPLYRGKRPSEFTEKDKVQIMVDNEMLSNGKLSEEFVRDIFKEGYRVNDKGIVEEVETKLTSRERTLIADMMRESKELGNDLGKIKEAVNNVR